MIQDILRDRRILWDRLNVNDTITVHLNAAAKWRFLYRGGNTPFQHANGLPVFLTTILAFRNGHKHFPQNKIWDEGLRVYSIWINPGQQLWSCRQWMIMMMWQPILGIFDDTKVANCDQFFNTKRRNFKLFTVSPVPSTITSYSSSMMLITFF